MLIFAIIADLCSMDKKFLIAVLGPTAIGKTRVAIALAQHFHTEVISSDSRQFYRQMCIGTAVPEPEELAAVPHHFIQHIDIAEKYSVGNFEKEALEMIGKLHQNGNVAIMAGGSGLYSDAVIKGLDQFPQVAPEVREALIFRLENEGLESLQKELEQRDPGYYQRVDIMNPHRVIRALEICIGSGRPYSSFLTDPRRQRPFTTLKIGLEADRKIIYDRIDQRVDLMVQRGLVEEARQLYPQRQLNALQTVGYRELFRYFEGEWSLDRAVEEIKKNTRRFAKRQLTWYRKDPEIHWFDYNTPETELTRAIEEMMAGS